ncbi:hypothetical protein ACIRG5_19900 [Lentzea sp. NPDC102401]|uniref:hypothetical protein n=1 Tax=Lentzea sp. NPDC102401 TaxID=3364128 RepID=UPI0037FB3015
MITASTERSVASRTALPCAGSGSARAIETAPPFVRFRDVEDVELDAELLADHLLQEQPRQGRTPSNASVASRARQRPCAEFANGTVECDAALLWRQGRRPQR